VHGLTNCNIQLKLLFDIIDIDLFRDRTVEMDISIVRKWDHYAGSKRRAPIIHDGGPVSRKNGDLKYAAANALKNAKILLYFPPHSQCFVWRISGMFCLKTSDFFLYVQLSVTLIWLP